MANIRSSYQEIEIPFAKMSWNSDVPSSQLGPNEYNTGQNIETDVRGIKTILGIEPILSKVPEISGVDGTPMYITGGYRQDGQWYYIVGARYGSVGRWFQINFSGVTNITPGYSLSATASVPGWTGIPNITTAWNGTALIINDGINRPYYLQDNNTEFKYYSNVADYQVYNITYTSTTVTLELNTYATNTPYQVGDIIILTDAYTDASNPLNMNGTFTITAVTNPYTIQYSNPGYTGTYQYGGLVRPKYQWNYNPEWSDLYAGFNRVNTAPNVGSLLFAGNLTVQVGKDWTFDLNSTNTIQINGTLLVNNYIGYEISGTGIPANTTITGATVGSPSTFTLSNSATITQSSVLLTLKKATTDNFPNTVRWSQNFGLNQVPTTWAPTINNVANELEVPLRGSALDGFPAQGGNFYVSSYWDTVVFTPVAYQTTQVPVFSVRLFAQGRGLLSSNCWTNADDKVYGIDARDVWQFDGANFVGLGNQRVKNYIFENIKAGQQYTNIVFIENNTAKNQIELYFPNNDATTYCNEMISYRYDIDTFNPPWRWTTTDNDPANATPIIGATEGPVFRADEGNIFDPSTRTVTVITPISSNVAGFKQIAQKDHGFSFIDQANSSVKYNITATFRRDNIQLLKDYSGQLLLHRALPEVNNINEFGRETFYANTPNIQANVSNVLINIGGSDSVGEIPTMTGNITLRINTTDPWVQITQNAYRLNTIEFNHVSNQTAAILTSITYQYTQTQDAR